MFINIIISKIMSSNMESFNNGQGNSKLPKFSFIENINNPIELKKQITISDPYDLIFSNYDELSQLADYITFEAWNNYLADITRVFNCLSDFEFYKDASVPILPTDIHEVILNNFLKDAFYKIDDLLKYYVHDYYTNYDTCEEFAENLQLMVRLGIPMFSNGRLYIFTELKDPSEWPTHHVFHQYEDDEYDPFNDIIEDFDLYNETQISYKRDGPVHRALSYVKSYHVKDSLGHCQWYSDGKLSRPNKKDPVYIDNTSKYKKKWYVVDNRIRKYKLVKN